MKTILAKTLPKSSTFWRKYVSHIGILKDSQQLKMIRTRAVELLQFSSNDRFLDIGCGPGQWLIETASIAKAVTGLDVEQGMLDMAKGRIVAEIPALSSKITLQRGSAESMPFFKNDSFDKIGSTLVFGYLDGKLMAEECLRILKPGGKIVIVTPAAGARFSKVLRAEARSRKDQGVLYEKQNLKKLLKGAVAAYGFGKIAELKAFAGQWHFYKENELEKLMISVGFKSIRMERVYADQAILVVAEKPYV